MVIFVNVRFYIYQYMYFSLEHTAMSAEISLGNGSGKGALH